MQSSYAAVRDEPDRGTSGRYGERPYSDVHRPAVQRAPVQSDITWSVRRPTLHSIIRVIRGKKEKAPTPCASTPQPFASLQTAQPLTTHYSQLTTATKSPHSCNSCNSWKDKTRTSWGGHAGFSYVRREFLYLEPSSLADNGNNPEEAYRRRYGCSVAVGIDRSDGTGAKVVGVF